MLVLWLVLGLTLLPLLEAVQSSILERKTSTMLSFDLRRKTKHHRVRNSTHSPNTPAPTKTGNEEEMEFSLRVCVGGCVHELKTLTC